MQKGCKGKAAWDRHVISSALLDEEDFREALPEGSRGRTMYGRGEGLWPGLVGDLSTQSWRSDLGQ